MRAITIWEPWATLLSIGAKHFETRSWPTTYRGPIAIHAAKREPNYDAIWDLGQSVAELLDAAGVTNATMVSGLGCILAIADLVGCPPTAGLCLSPQERAFGDFAPGRFAWKIENVRQLPRPVPARGMQALWEWQAPEGEI